MDVGYITKEFANLSPHNRSELDIIRLLRDNGFSQQRSDVPKGIQPYIEAESDKLSFGLPENYILMQYYLGDQDFDEAQLILPNLKGLVRNLNPNITLNDVRTVSKGMSELIPEIPLLEVYGNKDKFALPRFRLYSKGNVERESTLVGERQYSEDFREQDRQRDLGIFKKIVNRQIV